MSSIKNVAVIGVSVLILGAEHSLYKLIHTGGW
jgi:hypothetical protein